MTTKTLLNVHNLSVDYGKTRAIDNVSFSLPEGEIGCLLGPSGCGKTTLLRTLAGFELPTEGRVILHGNEVSHSGWALQPEKRNIGMVFQDFALFPNMTVFDNINFGLQNKSAAQQKIRVQQLLDIIGMQDSANKYPHQLSGGQQQRIA